MKRKPFILVAFLLCLYLIPTFASAASWIEVTSADMEFDTPGWNNITSAEMGFVTPDPPSDQSITGFNETLPDDVLFYPDAFANTTESLAINGDDDYIDSLAVDAVNWVVSFGTHETIYYDYNTEFILDGFTYHHYGYYSSTPNPAWCALEYYNSFTDTWDTVMNFTRDTPVNPHWTNDTFYFPNKFTPLALGMRVIASSSDSSTGSTDYLGIEMIYLTIYSNASYAESFSDISDWTKVFNSNTTATSDYDVVSFDWNWDGAGTDYLSFYSDVPSLDTSSGDYYVEIRHNSDITSAYKGFHLLLYAEDGMGGTSQQMNNLNTITGWMTTKLRVTADVIESIRIYAVFASAANPFDTDIDYLRIARSNETGWQHDGSTVEGVDDNGNSHYDFYKSSDGDILNLTTVRNNATVAVPSGGFYFYYDTTATKTDLETSYYPFFKMRYKFDAGSVGTVYLYIGGKTISEELTHDDEWHTVLFNIGAGTGTANAYVRIVIDYTYTLGRTRSGYIDYMKLYSIAKWSYYAPSATVSDYFYTEAGTLYSEKSSNASQQLTYDIELSTNTTIFEFANISTGAWTGTGDYSYGFDYDVGAGWAGYTYDETLIALDTGTLEAIRIIVKDSGAISAISFVDPLSLWWEAALADLMFRVKDWFLVITAVLNFLVKLYEFTWFFILAGLVMIPTSTLFLVRGGKDDMSRDKLFLFFLIFLFGWAFVLGGIL